MVTRSLTLAGNAGGALKSLASKRLGTKLSSQKCCHQIPSFRERSARRDRSTSKMQTHLALASPRLPDCSPILAIQTLC